MIKEERLKIQCPKCGKLLCTMNNTANPSGIYFWCPRCKTEFEIKESQEKRLFRAHEADNS